MICKGCGAHFSAETEREHAGCIPPTRLQVGGDYYKDMVIQPVEFCQKNKLGFCESLAIKYICRHSKKNGLQDIQKAIHCLYMLEELEYRKEK